MPEENEDTGFVVRDRRRFNSDAPAAPPSPSPEPPPAAPTPPPAAAPPERMEIPPLDLNAAFAAGQEAETQAFDEAAGFAGGFGEEGAEDPTGLPDVYSVLALFLGELRNLSLVRLGLVPNPMTGQPERDLAQARVAIDTVAFLAHQLDAVVAPDEREQLQGLVNELQVNFVNQAKRSGGASGILGGGA